MFTWVDYVIIAIIGLSVVVSLVRGFVREALSLVTWAVAFWVSFSFSGVLANMLTGYIHSASLRQIASFGILFLITLLLGAFINYLIAQLVDSTGLTGTDRVLGVIFGFARGVLVVSLLLMLARLTPMPQEDWWKASLLVPQFQPIELWLHGLLPKSVSDHITLSY
jgi:membrane protein required for colicin V production